jgi:hypothetical protein
LKLNWYLRTCTRWLCLVLIAAATNHAGLPLVHDEMRDRSYWRGDTDAEEKRILVAGIHLRANRYQG